MSNSHQGYTPSFFIRFLRYLSRLIIQLFQIKGDSRWGNEFIQQINPFLITYNPIYPKHRLCFRTGHGRLFWRSKVTPYLETETNNWIESFQPDDIFYDIGVNTRVYSLMASQTHNIESFAFEMDLQNLSILSQNIFINNLQSKVVCMPFALADRNSIRTVFLKSVSPADALHSIDSPSPSIDTKNLDNILETKICCFSLDNLVSTLNLPLPTHVKIDIDGQESLLVKGAMQTLKYAKTVMIETSYESHNDIVFLFESNGFHLSCAFESHNWDKHNRNCLFIKRLPLPYLDKSTKAK